MMLNKTYRFIFAMAYVIGSSGGVRAACDGFADVSIASLPSVVFAPYSPFQANPTAVVTLTLRNASPFPCDTALAVTATDGVLRLTGAGGSLLATAEGASGEAIVHRQGFVAGQYPALGGRLDALVPANGISTLQLRARLQDNQLAPAGNYIATAGLVVGLYALDNARRPVRMIQERPLVLSATVVPACRLPAPNIQVMDFSQAVVHGRPNPAIVRRATISDVACTAPATLRLSGEPMRSATRNVGSNVQDAVVHWRATAQIGTTTAVLDTTSATEATASSRLGAVNAVGGGTMAIDIGLSGSKPIVAGTYQGRATFTLSLEP